MSIWQRDVGSAGVACNSTCNITNGLDVGVSQMSQSVFLDPLVESDKEVLFHWINDRDIMKYSSTYKEVSWDDHCVWFKNIRENPNVAIFGIRINKPWRPGDKVDHRELIGVAQLVLQKEHNRAELLIRVWKPDKGFGTQAINKLVDIGFKVHKLHRIYLHVFSWNVRAIHVYEKCGFNKEGLLKDDVIVDGKYIDQVVMAKLNEPDKAQNPFSLPRILLSIIDRCI